MAPSKRRNVILRITAEQSGKRAKIDLNTKVKDVLQDKKNANDVFDILELLEVNKQLRLHCYGTRLEYMLVSRR